jgi:hypothetical protein
LEWLDKSPAKAIVIADAPVDPVWRKRVLGQEWDGLQTRFTGMLREEAARCGKVRFLDFVDDPVLDLDTADFYDGYHFNKDGATLYTAYLADMIAREILPSLGEEETGRPNAPSAKQQDAPPKTDTAH